MPLSARRVAELQVRRALTLVRSRRQPRRKRPTPPRWPSAARLAYHAALKAVVADLRAGVERELIPKLPRLLALVEQDKPRMDGGELRLDATGDLKRELDAIADVVDNVIPEKRAEQIARKAGEQTSAFNKDEVNAQFRGALGIDLLHGEPYLQQQLDMFAQDNARLITSLATQSLDDVAGIVMRAARAGTQVGDVADEIRKRFDVVDGRAELIARDQVGKLNGELTQLRHQAVGVTEYEWSTSRDERVRTRHAELEGTSHSWDEPPVVDEKTGRKAHPGQDFQCRCTAIPKVDDLLAALGLGEGDVAGPPSKPPAAPPPAPEPPPSTPPPPPVFLGPEEPPKPLDREEIRARLSGMEPIKRDEFLERPTDQSVQYGRSILTDVSPREIEAIEYFGSDQHYNLTAVELRQFDEAPASEIKTLQRHVDNLYVAIDDAEALARRRSDEPITLYRGLGSTDDKLLSDHLVADELSIQRLSSWSSDPMVAYEFAGRRGQHQVILEQRTAKGLPIAARAPVTGESESILGKTRYRVVERRNLLDLQGRHKALYLVVEEIEE